MNHRPVSLRLVAALLAVAGLLGGGCADTLTAPAADEAVFTDMAGAGKKGAGNTRNSEPEASYVILFNPAMDTAEVTATAKRIVRKYG
ncbi:MAG: hypothetical protein R3362_11995, partial [Rhodothermales bacterium]|nr:hypothetical protein [Rhodothermales bacterium]